MHIASHAYTANREATSHFEGSKKELSLNTKTTTTHKTETIKKMLSDSGPESVLASKGEYSRMRTFAAGPNQRAILAFSPSTKRVDGFVMNKDQHLVPIKPYDLPKELQQILNSDAFEAFLNDVHARLIPLHNGDFRLALHQGLKGGVYSKTGNVEKIKKQLTNASSNAWGGRHESRIIIENKCDYTLSKVNQGLNHGDFGDDYPEKAFLLHGNQHIIPQGAAGGIFCDSTLMSPSGVQGYISLKVETDAGGYLAVCGFSTNTLGENAANILIRPIDKSGNIGGHGIDSTGKMTDRCYFLIKTSHHGGDLEAVCFQKCPMFDVYCYFDNKTKAYFTFKFERPTQLGSLEPLSNRLKKIEDEQIPMLQQQINRLNVDIVDVDVRLSDRIVKIEDERIPMLQRQINELNVDMSYLDFKLSNRIAAIEDQQAKMQNTFIEMIDTNQQMMNQISEDRKAAQIEMDKTLRRNEKVTQQTLKELAQNQSVINSNQAFLAHLMDRLEKLS